MKKFGYLIPIVLFLLFSMMGTRMFAAGNISPTTLVIVMAVALAIILLVRPKAAAPKPAGEVDKKVRGEFAKDAFRDDSPISVKFQSALSDYSKNMPKSALNKLNKLAPQCRSKEERYAVSVATALVHITLQNFTQAIAEYTSAIVLHPSAELALALGSCHQRLGELDQAKDSYEFALDLEAGNIEARSSLATVYVADGDYETALEQAMLALEQDGKFASALATAAICYGMLDDPILHKQYTKLAVDNGYSEKKITETVAALKKRK